MEDFRHDSDVGWCVRSENDRAHGMYDGHHSLLDDLDKGHASSRDLPIKVHVVEPDVRLRAAMGTRLHAAGMAGEIYANFDELRQFAPRHGVILINEAEGAGAVGVLIGQVVQDFPGFPVLVYSTAPSIAAAVAALKAQASSYLPLEDDPANLITAIRTAQAEAGSKRSLYAIVSQSQALLDRLSARERQVLELLVNGESNKSMARLLDLSPRTVEIHRTRLMGKLGARTSAQAVRIWCSASLVA